MNPYLEFFIVLALACVLFAIIRRVGRSSRRAPTSNPITQVTAENRTLAYQLVRSRLSSNERRNLVRLVLALANTGTYKYGTLGLLNAVPNTYPLTNTMQRSVFVLMKGSLFSAERLISKETNKIITQPPTNGEYNEMVEALSTDELFLVVCVQHSDKLGAVLRFLESPERDIEELLPESQALTVHHVEVLEGICREVFRPLP